MKNKEIIENNEVVLPALDTVWFIMANHAKQKHSANLITYDDLMYFKYLLNINLRDQLGANVPLISVATTFKDEKDKKQAYLNNPYAKMIITNRYCNEEIMPPFEEMKKAYKVLLEHKAKKQGAKAYGGALEREVQNNILLENYDELIREFGDEYFEPKAYEEIHEGLYAYERYKFFADTKLQDPISCKMITFADIPNELVEEGLEKLVDDIINGNKNLNRNKVKTAIMQTLSKMEALNLIEDNIKFTIKCMEIGNRYHKNPEK